MNATRAIPVFGFAVLLRAATASAETPTAEAAAQLLFEQGRDAMRRAAYTEACPKFAESQRLDPSNGTLLNLILCEEKLGKIASAWLHARELVERLPPDDPRKKIAERRLTALSPRLPRLALRLSPDAPRGTSVSLDGEELDLTSSPTSLPIDPGLHHLLVKAPNRADRPMELSVEEGRTYEFLAEPGAEHKQELAAPPAVAAPPASPPRAATVAGGSRSAVPVVRRTESSSPPRWLGWTAGGVGVAALAASSIFGAMVLDRKQTVDEKCPDKLCKDQSGLDAGEDGKTLEIAAIASLAVGAAGIGFGIYTLTRGDAERGGARASIVATPSSALLSYRASF